MYKSILYVHTIYTYYTHTTDAKKHIYRYIHAGNAKVISYYSDIYIHTFIVYALYT